MRLRHPFSSRAYTGTHFIIPPSSISGMTTVSERGKVQHCIACMWSADVDINSVARGLGRLALCAVMRRHDVRKFLPSILAMFKAFFSTDALRRQVIAALLLLCHSMGLQTDPARSHTPSLVFNFEQHALKFSGQAARGRALEGAKTLQPAPSGKPSTVLDPKAASEGPGRLARRCDACAPAAPLPGASLPTWRRWAS